MSWEDIENTSIESWKEKFKIQARSNSFSHLNFKQGSKSQAYSQLKMSIFLRPNQCIGINDKRKCQISRKIQCHMVENVKANFKHDFLPNLTCNSCGDSK